MNALVGAPHLSFGALPSSDFPTSTTSTSSSSNTASKPSSSNSGGSGSSKPRLRPLSLLIDTPISPPPRPSGSRSANTSPPGSAPATATPPPGTGRRRPHVKRVSSISYSPRKQASATGEGTENGLGSPVKLVSPPTPASAPGPSLSSTSSTPAPFSPPAHGRHAPGTALPNPAGLTLAEKHADLLTFIAQKESRVMELRRQLSEAEKELQGLKKKWEGLVARNQAGLSATAAGAGAGAGAGAAGAEKKAGVGEVLKQGTKMIGELVFDSPVTSLSTPASATNTSASGLGLFSPTSGGKPTHVQMQPMRHPPATAGRDSISSLSSTSGSSTTTSTSTDDSLPRSPSPLSALSNTTAKPSPFSAETQGPTLQALTSTLARAVDGIRASETYTTSSKRASQLLSTGLGQLTGLGFGLSGFSSPTSQQGKPILGGGGGGGGGKGTGLADYGEGRLTSPTSRNRASLSGTPSSSLTDTTEHSSRPSLTNLTLGITAQVSQRPALSPIPSPRSGSGASLLDEPLDAEEGLQDPLMGRNASASAIGSAARSSGLGVLLPSPAPSASQPLHGKEDGARKVDGSGEDDEGEDDAWGW